jgi:hypothetical protein
MRFRIFDVETDGDSLWAMTIADVPIVHGLFDVALGPIDLPFDEQYWLEIVVDGNVLAPRVQLTTSPYAFRAAVADSFTGGISPWTQDTMVAHWDSIRGVPAGFADGIDNTDDDDWSRSGNHLYTFNTTDSVVIGGTTAYDKLDVNGSVTIRGEGGSLRHGSGLTSNEEHIRFTGSHSDYIVSVQDGSGRIQHYWNSTTASPSNLYLADNERAWMWDISIATHPYMEFKYAPAGLAGDPITWTTHMAFDTLGNVDVLGDVTANAFIGDGSGLTGIADGDWTVSGTNMHSAVSGNVGIGTTTPVKKLEVAGNAAFSGTVSGADAVEDDEFVTKGQITGDASLIDPPEYSCTCEVGPEYFDTEIPASWEIDNLDGGEAWRLASHLGNSMAKVNFSPTYYADDYLITPSFTAGSSDSVIFSCYILFQHFNVEMGSSFVALSVDGGVSYAETLYVIPSLSESSEEEERLRFRIDNLSTPLSSDNKIAFIYKHYNSYYWYVDSVSVCSHSLTEGVGLWSKGDGCIFNLTDNVGIGVVNPETKLHVNGDILCNSALFLENPQQAAIFYSKATGVFPNFYFRSSDDPYTYDPSCERLFIGGSSGNVGIGTTTPTLGKLVVNDGRIVVNQNSEGYCNGVLVYSSGGINDGYVSLSVYDTDKASIQAGDNLIQRDLLLNPDGGNVGIGTTSPGYKLDVYSSGEDLGNGTIARVCSDGSFISGGLGGTFNIYGSLAADHSVGPRITFSSRNAHSAFIEANNEGTGTSGRLHLGVRDITGAFTKTITINKSNNVGIGTTAPASKLDVRSEGMTGTNDGLIVNTNGSGVNTAITAFAFGGTENYALTTLGDVSVAGRLSVSGYRSGADYGNRAIGYFYNTNTGGESVGIYGYAKGIGGVFESKVYGIYANVDASAAISGQTSAGVFADITGGDGTNIGIWGRASGGGENWAGYFDDGGKVHIGGKLSIGSAFSADYQSHRLYVKGSETGVSGTTGYFKNTTGTDGIALMAHNTSTSSTAEALLVNKENGTGNIVRFDQGNPWNVRFRFTIEGDGRCDGSWIGGGSDFAEFFELEDHSAQYEPGDVIVLSKLGYFVETVGEPYSKRVLGVYTTNPGFIGGATAEEDPPNSVPVGLIGVCPTKVCTENGSIEIGDYLTTSSTPGVAMKASKPCIAIGRAMDSFEEIGIGKINIFVNAGWHDTGNGYQKLEAENAELRARIERLERIIEEK